MLANRLKLTILLLVTLTLLALISGSAWAHTYSATLTADNPYPYAGGTFNVKIKWYEDGLNVPWCSAMVVTRQGGYTYQDPRVDLTVQETHCPDMPAGVVAGQSTWTFQCFDNSVAQVEHDYYVVVTVLAIPPPGTNPLETAHVIVTTLHKGVPQQGYSLSAVGPNDSKTFTTDQNGNGFADLIPGTYDITATGTSPSGGADVATKHVQVNKGLNQLAYDFQDDGTDHGGNTNGDGNSAGLLGGLVDAITNALQSLFVPKPCDDSSSGCADIKSQVSSFTTWGPFNLITEAVALKDLTATGSTGLAIPNFTPHMQLDGQPALQSDGTTIPISLSGFASGFAPIKAAILAGLWIWLAVYLMGRLFPTHTV